MTRKRCSFVSSTMQRDVGGIGEVDKCLQRIAPVIFSEHRYDYRRKGSKVSRYRIFSFFKIFMSVIKGIAALMHSIYPHPEGHNLLKLLKHIFPLDNFPFLSHKMNPFSYFLVFSLFEVHFSLK